MENKKVATFKKSELKSLLKELLLEMKKTGELNEVLASIGVSQMPLQAIGQPQRPHVDPTISLLAAAATQGDPTKKSTLESIFMDTARSIPKINEAEAQIPRLGPNYGQEGHPAFTALNAYGNGYQQYQPNYQQQYQQQAYQQPIQQGYINTGYVDPNQMQHMAPQGIPQQQYQQPQHPLARIAFNKPLKNTINDS
jgi:hypothetical protein